ncbi:MAG TPA: sigma-70 family RNA polymerase sigma factor [bacterium]|nr:sigma-70 family RNA polymerase sigma factor [bacterium]
MPGEPQARTVAAAPSPTLSPYNICRLLAAHSNNRRLAARALGISVARLNATLADRLDEYRLLIFLFAPSIRDAYNWYDHEPLFARKQARKFYDIYRPRIRAFKEWLRRHPVGDHYAAYCRLFGGDARPHATLTLAVDTPAHRSLYSVMLTLHLCKYQQARAARRLGLTRYLLTRALHHKPDEALTLLLLFNRTATAARAAAVRLGFLPAGWRSFVRAQQPLLAAYRHRLRTHPGDPYAAYQVVFKGHVPGQAGFDQAILKRMMRVWRREENRNRDPQPLLFSLPDAYLHPHLLEKVRESSFRFWHDAMLAFISQEKLPFTYDELNRREEEHRRSLLARGPLAELRAAEQHQPVRPTGEPANRELPSADHTDFMAAALPATDERDLVRRAQAGNRAAEQALLKHHQRLLSALAMPLAGHGLDRDDLVSEGALGLLHALRRFRPERSVRFATYATWWIRKYMHEALARHLGLSMYHYEHFLKVRHVLRDETRDRGSEPDAARVAQLTGFPAAEVEQLLLLTGGPVSLDAAVGASATLGDYLAADTVTDKLSLDAETTATLNDLLRRFLSLREELVIRYRMGFGPGFIALPLEETGRLLGVSRTAVQMIEQGALAKLNDPAIRPYLQDIAAAT